MKRILIIEDDKVVAGVYRQRFLDMGYAVDLAPDGIQIRLRTEGLATLVADLRGADMDRAA